MNRIAIFGAKGYLGRQLDYFMSQKGSECDSFDIPECDVTRCAFWKTFDPTRYQSVLFFAGLTGTERGFSEAVRYVMVNETGLLNLLDRLAPLGVQAPKVIFPSSRLVYKGADRPLVEDDPKETRTVYAVNKLACEGYLQAYHNRFGLPYAVVRICVPYGNLISSDYSYGTIGFFLRQAAAGRITLYGGGCQRRTFTHVHDICEAVYRLVSMDVTGVFNLGGCDRSLKEAAEQVATIRQAIVESVPWPYEAKLLESGSTVFDDSRIVRETGMTFCHELAW